MTIYDRSQWPEPTSNPLVIMLERGDEWYSNTEILAALGYAGSQRSLIASWPTLAEQLGEEHTGLVSRGLLYPNAARQPRGGGQERMFSRKALILIAMRAQTVNAAAFCDWLAADQSLAITLGQI